MQVALYDYGITPDSSSVTSHYLDDATVVVDLWSEMFCPEGETVGVFSSDFTWRDFVRVLMELSEGHVDQEAFDDIRVSGATGACAIALKYAWILEGRDYAIWIAAQSEQSILQYGDDICAVATPFGNSDLQDFISNIRVLGLSADLLKAKVELGLSADAEVSLTELFAIAEQRLECEQNVKRNERTVKLAPFLTAIKRIAVQFDDRVGRASGFPVLSKRAIVERWLESYCLEHGELPVGSHEVRVPSMESSWRSAGSINFDHIKRSGD
jgi:hypothetical protein